MFDAVAATLLCSLRPGLLRLGTSQTKTAPVFAELGHVPLKNIIVHLPRRFSKESWGGTESVILNLSVELLRQGYRVMLRRLTCFPLRRRKP